MTAQTKDGAEVILDRSNLIPKEGKLKLSGDKVFYTLQGEGVSIGQPAVFIRLHFCNLACKWCDTKYTWDESLAAYFLEPTDWSYEDLIKEVSQYECRRVVFTGGEPLIQQEKINEFIGRFLDGYEVEVETNGTMKPSGLLADKAQFNVSPKLSNSGNVSRIWPQVLKYYNLISKSSFKFVVQQAEDLIEVASLVKQLSLRKDKIIIMPEATDNERMRELCLQLAETCKTYGWRLVPRLQVYLWGKKRAI